MNRSENCIAISLAIVTLAGPAWAEAGRVINLSGPLLAMAADGTQRVLSTGSPVEAQDTLLTGEKTYTRVKFTDDSLLMLRPGTQAKIAAYQFAAAPGAGGQFVLSLEKGALRLSTGKIGVPGGAGAYQVQTPAGTLSTRRATLVVEYVADAVLAAVALDGHVDTPSFARLARPLPLLALAGTTMTDVPQGYLSVQSVDPFQLAQNSPANPGTGGLAAGLYVHVIDGVINLTNRGGSQDFSAGQFGYTASIVKPPVVVPANPGIQFSPPPAFSSSAGPTSTGTSKPKTVDCEVR